MKLDGVVTLVDCKHAMQHLNEVKARWVVNEAVEQVAYADRIILNKVFSQSIELYTRFWCKILLFKHVFFLHFLLQEYSIKVLAFLMLYNCYLWRLIWLMTQNLRF